MGGGNNGSSVRFAAHSTEYAYEESHDFSMAESSMGDATAMLEDETYDDVSDMSYSASGVDNYSFVSSKNDYKLKGQLFAIDDTFTALDSDRDGLLDRNDIYTFMQQSSQNSKLQMDAHMLWKAVDALMEDVGVGCTRISKEEFRGLFVRHPDLMKGCFDEELSVVPARKKHMRGAKNTGARRITLEERQERDRDYRASVQTWAFLKAWWKSHKVAFVWTCLYGMANVIAFSYKAYKYYHYEEATDVFGSCIVVARGSASCLNLNCCLILLPLCRHFCTRLRRTQLRCLFPFDSVLAYHMVIGMVIAVLTTVHVSAHICDFHRFSHADVDDITTLFGTKLGNGDIPESVGGRWTLLLRQRAAITGIIMVLCMLIAYPLLRYRRQSFTTFWISHHLLLILLIALCFHGTGQLLEPFQSIYWVGGPLLLYLIPRLWRETPFSRQKALGLSIKEGGIVCLRLEKPNTWDGHVKAGMYAFINVPHISRFEWHPFTLTSSPSDTFIEFHISKAGDWTGKLHSLVEQTMQDHDQLSTRAICDASSGEICPSTRDGVVVVKVEGPMGAPSQAFVDYPIVVLVGAGIGVTPMISILKQLLVDPGQTKRCYLYWTTRDKAAFEWFSRLMADIFDANPNKHNNRIHVRHFLTSVKDDPRDIGAILLHHATRTKHDKTNFDMIQGNYSHNAVESGRPYWKEEFESVMVDAKELDCNECGIFLCGPEKMADTVEDASFALSKKDPNFHFHFFKETF